MTVVRYTSDLLQGTKHLQRKIFHHKLAVSSRSRETVDKPGGLAWGQRRWSGPPTCPTGREKIAKCS